MAILCIEDDEIADRWRDALRRENAELDVRSWPEIGRAEDIDMVLLWDEFGCLGDLPNLKAAVILGAGVDHLFAPTVAIPEHLKIIRLIDPSITGQMIEYVTLCVVTWTRDWDDYRQFQRERRYEELPARVPADVTIGVLGLGRLGGAVAQTLAGIGYRVGGWSSSPRDLEGIECFSGEDGLTRLFQQSDIIVCLLPLTAETEGILNADLFNSAKEGAYLINAARGGHLVEEDLIIAVDSGRLSGATLDVQREEPMAPEHPFWDHPKIKITPHIATITSPEYAAPDVAENYRRLKVGEPLLNVIDVERQY